MPSLPQRLAIVIAPLAALAGACTAFGGASDHGDAGPDGATSGLDAGDDALPTGRDGGARGDAGDPCSGATFCETFDTGALQEIEAQWDEIANAAGLSIITDGTRRALQSRLQNTMEARLSRSLGVITPAQEVKVLAVVKTEPATGSYELFTLDLHQGGGMVADYEVKSQQGKVVADGNATGVLVADGQWHTIELHVASGKFRAVIDGVRAVDADITRGSAEYFLRIGGLATSPTTATIQIDSIRVDVTPAE